MDMYFYLLTVIDLLVLAFTAILIAQSDSLSENKRRSFICSSMLIAFISVIEVAAAGAEGLPAKYRLLTVILNYLGFGLTPAVPICFAYCISDSRNLMRAIAVEAVYLIFLAATLPFGLVFSVDADNVYARGGGFFIYLAVCLYSIIYLVRATIMLMNRYQNKGRPLIIIMIGMLLFGAVTQIFYPQIHLTWLCVTLLLLLYYMYCCDIWQQVDGLTGLLSQKSYIIRTSKLKERLKLIVFDVDDFKAVNDNFGHLAGDECLKIIASCIRKAYAGQGLCYRIGGDEFCVLLRNLSMEEKCTRNFTRLMESRRAAYNILPEVSYGSAVFEAGDSPDSVKARADKNMYSFKQKRKQRKAEKAASVKR